MNIFLLSYERIPAKHYREQAAFHCDKHVVKMIAESVQLLVTALSARTTDGLSHFMPPDIQDSFPCKSLSKGHANHPCAIWARASISHVNYLCNLAIALCDEKAKRWPLNPWHEYQPWLLALRLELELLGCKPHDALPTNFAVAIKDARELSTSANHTLAVNLYRDYYIREKAGFATWKKTIKPLWFVLATDWTCTPNCTAETAQEQAA